MNMFTRFAAYWLVLFAAFALAAPATAQNSTSRYKTELDSLALEMRALWGEMDRFTVKQRYCSPPFIPLKQPDEMLMAAYSARADDLNARYAALKQSLKDFLAANPRLYAELLVDGIDPRNDRWWSRWESSRKKMLDERARKRALLARAPVVDCTPRPKPAPVLQAAAASPLPARPAIPAVDWPALPKQFCTWDEYWKFINDSINPRYLRAAENLEKATKFRSEVEHRVNDLVQQGKPIPAAPAALRRQAIADVAAMQRLSDESERIRRAVKAIPVVDCNPPQVETGMNRLDFIKIEAQQRYIGEAEGLIAQINAARLAGDCEKVGRLYDDLSELLYAMSRIAADAGKNSAKAFPPETLSELRRRGQAATRPCPPPGFKSRAQILEEARRAYRSAAQGSDQRTFQEAREKLLGALDAEIAAETRDSELDRLVRERGEVRTGELPQSGVLEDMAPPPTAPADPRMQTLLNEHNQARRIFGSPPLRWNPGLAASAQAYAQVLAQTGRLQHSPREGRGAARENLSQGLPGWGPQQLIANWVRERSRFKPGTYPDVSTTGRWEDVSHYSQMVWPKTTELGCGIADGRGFRWLVCHYTPGGNKDGVYIGDGPPGGDGAGAANRGPLLDPRELSRMKIGGGMQRIDPPANAPPPTATDPAPDGDERSHPLRGYFLAALDAHREALTAGNLNAQAEALAKMHYALQELVKRLREARRLRDPSKIDPAQVQQQINELNRLYRQANEASRPKPSVAPGEERG